MPRSARAIMASVRNSLGGIAGENCFLIASARESRRRRPARSRCNACGRAKWQRFRPPSLGGWNATKGIPRREYHPGIDVKQQGDAARADAFAQKGDL